jgi:hypothetical protein
VESEARELLSKEKPEPSKIVSTGLDSATMIGIDPAFGESSISVSSGWTTTTSTSVTFEDPMTKSIESIVRRILEEEGVLIGISGKAKKYSQTKVSISKLDQDVSSLKVEAEESSIDFLEELKRI